MDLITVLITSFLILSVFGSLMHFTHGWFKNGVLLHMFSAVNESTWEHMKLLVAPTLLVMVFQYIVLRSDYSNLINGILVLYIVEIVSIPLLYESLRLILKKIPFMITILIFYISIVLGLFSEYLALKNEISIFSELISLIFIMIITFKFGILTYFPPKIFLFKDPVTGRYGDKKHKNN